LKLATKEGQTVAIFKLKEEFLDFVMDEETLFKKQCVYL
jgi:hypothetical protein